MGRPPMLPEGQLSEIIQFRLTPVLRRRGGMHIHKAVRMDTQTPATIPEDITKKRLAGRGGYDPIHIDTDPFGRI